MKLRANQQISVCVAARFSNLPELLGLLSSGLNRAGQDFDRRIPSRAQLAVEELFANTIHHGYGAESDARVWLTVEVEASLLRITYEDEAAEFDPFAADLESFATRAVDDPRQGGLGRLLIKETARHCEYRREVGRNVVVLEYSLECAG